MINTKKNTPSSISPDEIVTLYKTPFENIIVSSYRQPGKGSIVKLNGDYYLNTATNEILPYKKSVCRSKDGLRKTLNDFRKYLRFFCGGTDEFMVTLTYKSFMTDQKQISSDIKKFIRRLKSKYNNTMFYLYIREPDENGSWHVHFLLKGLSSNTHFPDENEIRKMWDGDGYEVSVKQLYDIDGLNGYFNYFANLKKSGRLHYYSNLENNVRLFGRSRSMKIERSRLPYSEAVRESQKTGKTLSSKECFTVKSSDEKTVFNTIQYEFYKNNEEVDYHA